jgi:hypothetical protein
MCTKSAHKNRLKRSQISAEVLNTVKTHSAAMLCDFYRLNKDRAGITVRRPPLCCRLGTGSRIVCRSAAD